MDLLQDAPGVTDLVETVRTKDGAVAWFILGYSGDKLAVSQQGTGGLSEMTAHLSASSINYCMIRMNPGDRQKVAFITWVGEGADRMIRGQVNEHRPALTGAFRGKYHVDLFATTPEDVAEDVVLATVKKAGGANYDAGGAHQVFSGGEQAETEGEAGKGSKEAFTKPSKPGRGARRLVRKKE